MTTRKLILIDASIYIFKYYFSMPAHWQASNGRPTETVYAFSRWLVRLLDALDPSHIALCFDESLGSGFRHQLYPDYKANRALPDEDLAFQLLACKKIASLMGLPVFASEEFEADDLLATFALFAAENGGEADIMSRDKDLAQLLTSDRVRLWDFPDGTPLLAKDIREKLGVTPAQFPLYLALLGDPVDSVPGIRGVGKKTAALLATHFKTLDALLSGADQIVNLPLRGAAGIYQRVAENLDQICLAEQLVRLRRDAVEPHWDMLTRSHADLEALLALIGGLGFPASSHNVFASAAER